jgi:tryptophan synthase beta subunit
MTGNLPDIVTASVGGGSNAMAMFAGFIDDPMDLHGVEPLGKGTTLGEHSATMTYGMVGVIHGFRCYLLQDDKDMDHMFEHYGTGDDYAI